MKYETDFDVNIMSGAMESAKGLLGKGSYTPEEQIQLLGYNSTLLHQAAQPNVAGCLQERALETVREVLDALGLKDATKDI